MYGYIYKTSNLVNGKIYIGQKKSDVFLGNKYLGSGKKLKSAIMCYGKENFKVELVESVTCENLMDEKEIYWISYYNSTDDTIGYNISCGGNVNRTMRGKNHPMYGVSRAGSENPAYGRHWWTNGKEQVYQVECPEGWWSGVKDEVRNKHSKSSVGRKAWNKGVTKKQDSRLNGNRTPRSEEWKDNLSKRNSGSGNPMYGKAGMLKFKYIYNNIEFIGKGQLINYLNENGYPDFNSNHISPIVENKKLRKFPELTGKITKVKLTDEEILEIRKKWHSI